MFERFTENARRVVVSASEEARTLRHDYLGTEHFLLALIRDDQSTAGRLLNALGVQPATVRSDLEQAVPAGNAAETSGHLPFTPAAKQVLELTLLEAARLNSSYIGSGHVLLGLIREGHGSGARVLSALGVDLERARRAERDLREDGQPQA
ncbi:MAG TPA: Clp protease N-terminal domain-containing protein [Actinocrinis sp.]|nr:Clp protease N-terminal domain-containing protein [Actinocrinis sp.]